MNGTPPEATITMPVDGTTYTEGEDVTLSATASDSDGTVTKVEFYAGAAKLGEDGTEPYGYVWSGATVGSHSLTAVATDNDGLTGVSVPVGVTVGSLSPPSAPSGVTGQAVSSSAIDLSWTDNADNEDGFIVGHREGHPGADLSDAIVEVLDESGHDNHGTLEPGVESGPEWVEEADGGHYDFDGATGYISCGNDASLDVVSAMTVSAWVKLDSKQNYKGVVAKRSGGSISWILSLENSADQKWRFLTCSSSGEYAWSSDGTGAAVGTWTHVVGVYDGSEVILYVDGEGKTPAASSGLRSVPSEDVIIGAQYAESLVLDGQIDGVRIYTRSISSEEVSTLYSAGRSGGKDVVSTNDLVLFMPFSHAAPEWEEAAQVVADSVSYTDTGLTADTWYQYRVKATNGVGESVWSATAGVQTGAGAQNSQADLLVSFPGGNGSGGPRLVLARSRVGTGANAFGRTGEGDGLMIRWPSVAGRDYRLQKCSSLGVGTWTTVGEDIPATPPQNTITIEPLDATAFYRIVVVP